MVNKKIRVIGTVVLVVVWVVLAGFAWFQPAKELSEAERRPLEQMPELSAQTLLSGKFMAAFEEYALDQFPLRDSFRQLKSLFHYYVLNQKDNNDIYIADGHAAKLEYPLNQAAVNHALVRFDQIYETYLKDSGSTVFACVVPDKSYYLAEENGYLAMDYDKLFATVKEALPWAGYVDITDCLSIADYYYTDTHWRQEKLLPVAQKLSQVMGLTQPKQEDYIRTELERPFYGVYYGQAALPMSAEPLYILESPVLQACSVYSYDTDSVSAVYNMEKLTGKDLYDVYLSGAQSLLRIENPNALTDRELVVFRDSFGSSLIPLLVQDYKTVTLVDLRYISGDILGQYLRFNGQDVLFLFSTLVLNSGYALK